MLKAKGKVLADRKIEQEQKGIENDVILAFLRGGAKTVEDAAEIASCTVDRADNAVIRINRDAIRNTGRPAIITNDSVTVDKVKQEFDSGTFAEDIASNLGLSYEVVIWLLDKANEASATK